jgi:hypothetical protein
MNPSDQNNQITGGQYAPPPVAGGGAGQVPAYPQPQYQYQTPPAQQQQQPSPAYSAAPPPMYAQPPAPQPQPVAPPPVAPAQQQGKPQEKHNSNSTQNTLQIAEIRDGLVIMNDGSFRSVVMVKSINFDLMSPAEREGVESGYQAFLNSLYFPVQIFVRSQKVDLQPYIAKLDKIRTEQDNMLLALLMEDYIGFISELSYQTNIMDKRFYVVIPYFPVQDMQKAFTNSVNFFTGLAGLFQNKQQRVTINESDLEKAKTELRNRVQATLGGLMQCGIQGLPLDTQELIELYYDTYNPDTATRQQLKNFDDLSAMVITKGQGTAPQPQLDKDIL